MARIKVTAKIKASATRLFGLATDYNNRMEWDIFIKKMEFLEDATCIAKGIKTRTVAYNGMVMDTIFIAFDPPQVIAFEMIKGPWIFQAMAGSWRFEPQEAGYTQATFIYNFSTRFRMLRMVIEPVVAYILSHDMKKRLLALKQAAEKNG